MTFQVRVLLLYAYNFYNGIIAAATNMASKESERERDLHECIGPCHPAGKFVLHPITLTYVTDMKRSFCTIAPFHDPTRPGLHQYTTTKPCPVVNDTETGGMSAELFYTVPQLGMDAKRFLMVYDIYSYEDSSRWYREATGSSGSQNVDELQWATLRRVFNATFTVYGSEKLRHLDDESAEVIRDIIYRYWLTRWCRRFDMQSDEIMRIFTTDRIRQIVGGFYEAIKDSWQSTPSPMDLLKSTFANELETRSHKRQHDRKK
jgi:hypothetical protein